MVAQKLDSPFALISFIESVAIQKNLIVGKIGVYVRHNSVSKIELAHHGQEIQGCEKAPILVNALIFILTN